jgi:lycopene cyclase domain-containing protein
MIRSAEDGYPVTYFGFLGIFLVPPIVLLLLLLRRSLRWEHAVALAALTLIAVVYTTPWDNYLVIRGVWTFDRDKIANWFFWRVPVEEYIFYVLQVLLTGLFTIWLLRRTGSDRTVTGGGEPDSEG